MCISGSVKMNLWSCVLVIFVVGSASARSFTYQNITLSSDYTITPEDILKNVSKTVVEFNKNLDQFIDWVDFDKMFKEMLDHDGAYSMWSIGNVRKVFLESRDYYFKAVTSVYGWCGEINVLMTAYLTLFNHYSAAKRTIQKDIIINSLNRGIEKMDESVGYLDKSRDNMNTGIVGLSDVMANISEAFRHDQREHENKLHDLNQRVIGSFDHSVVGGIINLIMVEKHYKPEAREDFARIKSSFDFMKGKIKTSIDKALEIKNKLLAEIQNVVNIQVAANENKLLFKYEHLELVKEPAEMLKTKCTAYQTKHRLKV